MGFLIRKEMIMKIRKKIVGMMLAIFFAFDMAIMPLQAEEIVTCAEPRWNNIAGAVLTIGFDANNIGYFTISLNSYASCTGLSGQMRLYDENGNLLAGWAIYDDVEPYLVERTYQCQEGRTYTVTFQGYAYGNGSTMYDDINLSVTDICE